MREIEDTSATTQTELNPNNSAKMHDTTVSA